MLNIVPDRQKKTYILANQTIHLNFIGLTNLMTVSDGLVIDLRVPSRVDEDDMRRSSHIGVFK